jgi:hypothetical protein
MIYDVYDSYDKRLGRYLNVVLGSTLLIVYVTDDGTVKYSNCSVHLREVKQ